MSEICNPAEGSGGVTVVTTPAEIDITNAAALRAALADAASQGNGTLVVDMSQTRFCDSSGVNVLVHAHLDAQAKGGEVLLVTSAPVLRILTVIGADRVIAHVPALDQALGQAPAAPPAASASRPRLRTAGMAANDRPDRMAAGAPD
jgi:anti-anti-sigma factor